jgi:hypothetical protein
LIWGFEEWYNFDLGVWEYQKFESPWSSGKGRWLMIKGLWVRYLYWMDKTNASYHIDIHEQNENKGSQIGHTKQINKIS